MQEKDKYADTKSNMTLSLRGYIKRPLCNVINILRVDTMTNFIKPLCRVPSMVTNGFKPKRNSRII